MTPRGFFTRPEEDRAAFLAWLDGVAGPGTSTRCTAVTLVNEGVVEVEVVERCSTGARWVTTTHASATPPPWWVGEVR